MITMRYHAAAFLPRSEQPVQRGPVGPDKLEQRPYPQPHCRPLTAALTWRRWQTPGCMSFRRRLRSGSAAGAAFPNAYMAGMSAPGMAMTRPGERDAGASATTGGAARGQTDAAVSEAGGARGPAGRTVAPVAQQELAEPSAAAEAGGVAAGGEAGAAGHESGAVDQEDIWEFIHENIKARIRERTRARIRERIRKRHEYDYRVAIPRMLARAQAIEMAFESH